MASNTTDRTRVRSRGSRETAVAFACPTCDGQLGWTNGFMRCESCGHVPRHGAD